MTQHRISLDIYFHAVAKRYYPAARAGKGAVNAPSRLCFIIPTRSCWKFSKQICLRNFTQSIGIFFMIQAVETI